MLEIFLGMSMCEVDAGVIVIVCSLRYTDVVIHACLSKICCS